MLLACHGNNFEDVWHVDSGASKHMTGNKKLFSSLTEIGHGQVKIGDDRAYKIEGVCEVSCFPLKLIIGKTYKIVKRKLQVIKKKEEKDYKYLF